MTFYTRYFNGMDSVLEQDEVGRFLLTKVISLDYSCKILDHI